MSKSDKFKAVLLSHSVNEKQLYWVLQIQAKLSKTQPNSAPYISRKEYLMLTRNNKQ